MAELRKVAEGGSQTLARGLTALTLIGESEQPMSVPELASALGIHRSMAYRLVKTLEHQGFVERSPAGTLQLGLRLAALARGVARDLQAAAAPHLAALAEELSMTAFLVTYDGESAVTLVSAEPRQAEATIAQRPGTRHSVERGAPGRVIRSQLFPEQYPPRRFEQSHDEVLPGLASIAVPLWLPAGRAAAIAVMFIPHPLEQERVVNALTAASSRITGAMGSEQSLSGHYPLSETFN